MRTAELHLALATPSEDAAFNPEPIGPADLAAWMTRIRTEAEASFELHARGLAPLPHSHRILAEQLLGRRAELLERLARPPDTRWQGLKTRYHGDYHLGQVLVRRNDFVIIDFEGEPGRTPAERRAKHSPLRDVAGLLRSFNYARFTALKDRSTEQPRDYETLEPLARAWESQTRAAFLEAYARAVSGSPLYVDFDRMAELLELFELEKAFYELRYELNNRPDWSDIPLHGLLAVGASTPGL